MSQKIKVEGSNSLVKNMDSKAVINSDNAAYLSARRARDSRNLLNDRLNKIEETLKIIMTHLGIDK